MLQNKKEHKSFIYTLLQPCDSGGIQTHDLQNRNLMLYSAKLPSL